MAGVVDITLDTTRRDLIKEIKEHLHLNPSLIKGPSYQNVNKQLADLYLGLKEELLGIYHLTEAHAATLRQQTVKKFYYKDDMIKNPKNSSDEHVPVAQGLDKKYVGYDSELVMQEEKGLISRLRDMPKEWTVIQLTRQFDPDAGFKIPSPDDVVKPSCLHITRLPCGTALDENSLLTVMIPPPKHSDGMPTIFEIMKQSVTLLRSKETRPRTIRKNRETASQLMQDVVMELSNGYLKEWKCLLLGTLCNNEYSKQVENCIYRVVNADKHKAYKMEKRSYKLLCCVTSAAVHLSIQEIKSAVCCIVSCAEIAADLINAIEAFKEELPTLMVARRYPVILIIDEKLDQFPWEMLPVLKRHPVSRVPSIHFLHALYHLHKDHIVNGCRLVDKCDVGFYIVNPDADLKEMEARLVGFLEERMPNWKGKTGTSPTEEEFRNALIENNIFLYCGHFNGTHLLKPDSISAMRVIALPLLFGCSSIALQELGGRAMPTGVSDDYMIAGSACILGMLWTVTSDETDCMTVMMLNSWLPGEPIDLTSFRNAGDMLKTQKEPELLRLLRSSRETAHLFTNTAALVARGIPVKMNEK